MPQKVLITGATGLLGRQVIRAFSESKDWEAVGTGFSRAKPPDIIKLDLGDETAVERAIEDVKPDVIVHCAANRFPDSCASNPSATRALNITATSHLARLSSLHKILLIYISTDYVFPGVKGEAPYETTSTPRPTTFYGETKLDGEKAVLEAFRESEGKDIDGGKQSTGERNKSKPRGKGAILRVPVLYGAVEEPLGNKESAVNTLFDTVTKAAALPSPSSSTSSPSNSEPLKIDDWSQRYPTNTEDVARVIRDIANKYANLQKDEELPPILQFSTEEQYTKLSICQKFAEILGVDVQGKLVGERPDEKKPAGGGGGGDGGGKGGGAATAVQRPYDTHLSTRSLKELGIDTYAQDFGAWWRWRVGAFRK